MLSSSTNARGKISSVIPLENTEVGHLPPPTEDLQNLFGEETLAGISLL